MGSEREGADAPAAWLAWYEAPSTGDSGLPAA
jgi:hypothetical protein